MTLAMADLLRLQDSLRSDKARVPDKIEGPSCYHVGAVWFGDWRDMAKGSGFGNEIKPLHNACLGQKPQSTGFFTFCPITSLLHNDPRAVMLPLGAIPGGRATVSYLLSFIRLLITRGRLDQDFEYKTHLPKPYIQDFKTKFNRRRI